MGQFLEAGSSVIPGEASFTWVYDEFLVDRDVAYWSELPLWLPESVPWRLDIKRALQAGLQFRPVAQTIADIYSCLGPRRSEWPVESVWSSGGTALVGLARHKEADLLRQWRLRAV